MSDIIHFSQTFQKQQVIKFSYFIVSHFERISNDYLSEKINKNEWLPNSVLHNNLLNINFINISSIVLWLERLINLMTRNGLLWLCLEKKLDFWINIRWFWSNQDNRCKIKIWYRMTRNKIPWILTRLVGVTSCSAAPKNFGRLKI